MTATVGENVHQTSTEQERGGPGENASAEAKWLVDLRVMETWAAPALAMKVGRPTPGPQFT